MKKNAIVVIGMLFTISVNASRLSSRITNGSINADTLKVMTYNVHHCNPPGKATQGLIDISAIAKAIQGQDPDLVALQEMDNHTTRSGKNVNETEEIAKALGMYFYFGKAIDYGGGGYGVAILSKYPMTEMNTMPLSKEADPKAEQRVLATARIRLKSGKEIRFACTHLDVANAANRILQVNEITQNAIKDSLPFILGGDLNETPLNKPVQLLDEYFQRTCIQCPPTFPQDVPKDVIDYIAYYKKFPLKLISHSVVEETYASDHRPLVAILIIE